MRKSDEDHLANVFHDEICFCWFKLGRRLKTLGFGRKKSEIFSLRSQLLAESSAWKKRKILDEWLGFGFEGTHSDVEVGNGLFLRGNV